MWVGAGSVSACVRERMEFQSRGGISLLVYITMGYRVERRSLDKFLHGWEQRLIALKPEFCFEFGFSFPAKNPFCLGNIYYVYLLAVIVISKTRPVSSSIEKIKLTCTFRIFD